MGRKQRAKARPERLATPSASGGQGRRGTQAGSGQGGERVPPSEPAGPGARRTLPLALGALALVAGAGGALLALRGPGAAVRREPGFSVLLVSIDTLRADTLGAYGHPRVETPWIDRLAREGVRFEAAQAHNVVTLPSHANLLSGLLPFEHGIRDNSGFRFPPETATLATHLKAQGYRTGAFVSAFPLDSRFGLGVGFDHYDDRLGGAETRTGRAFLVPERSAVKTVAAALAWNAEASAPSFSFVHVYEPHFPYEPPEPFASRFREHPYEGEVSAVDAALEPLLRPILEADKGGRTLVVLTSDHGEALGEHGEETHGIFAYEATLRVPLILYAPRLLSPRVVREPVRHVDVLPTVLDALGLEAPAGLPGRSLLPLAAGHASAAPPGYFEALSSSLNQGWAPLRGVRRDHLKYIDLPLPELYDLLTDPREERNLAASRPDDLEAMRTLLLGLRSRERSVSRVKEDAGVAERLRALGYLAGGDATAKERYEEADDPKRLVALDKTNSEIVSLFRARQFGEAAALARKLTAERPDSPLAWSSLAAIERSRGDLEAAIEAVRRALRLRPSDAESAALLAVYMTEAGRAQEVLALLAPFLETERLDPDLLTAQGMALARLGRREEALAAFGRAAKDDPTSAMVLVNTGTVHLMAGDLGPARRAFDAALALDADVARAHNGLGVVAAQEGRLEEAVAHWKEAGRLEPSDYQALFNLGTTLRRLGRADEARPYLDAYLLAAPAKAEAKDIARVRGWLAERGGS